jgi:hypothetical protein
MWQHRYVALWRSVELETILGGPLDGAGLTEAAIQNLVNQRARESELLDFKRECYPGAPRGASVTWTKEQEFAKDVTAFANHRGGLILIGVGDKDEAAETCSPTVLDPGAQEQRLRRALVNYGAPPPAVTFVPIPAAAGNFYLAVVVPPSVRAPHAVTGQPGDGRRPLHYFVRDGADVRPLSEAEVADRYRRRLVGAEERRARRDRVVREGRESLQRSEGLWLYIAAIAELPVPATLDAESMRDAERWRQQYVFQSPMGGTLGTLGMAIAAPGRATFTGLPHRETEEIADPRENYLELHVDGAAFVATQLHKSGNGTVDVVRVIELVDTSILATDASLSWTVRQGGAWGMADLVIGLIDAELTDDALSRPVALGEDSSRGLRPTAKTRLLRRPPSAVISVDLTGADTTQGRLQCARNLTALLLQFFGKAVPDQLAADGSLILSAWGRPGRVQIVDWASRNGVGTRESPNPARKFE